MRKQRNNKGVIKVSVEESGCPGQFGSPDALTVKLMSSDLPVETSGGTGSLLGKNTALWLPWLSLLEM